MEQQKTTDKPLHEMLEWPGLQDRQKLRQRRVRWLAGILILVIFNVFAGRLILSEKIEDLFRMMCLTFGISIPIVGFILGLGGGLIGKRKYSYNDRYINASMLITLIIEALFAVCISFTLIINLWISS